MTRRILLLVAVALVAGCDITEFSTVIVTAQVVRTLDPESNTASVLVGKATVANLFSYEWMETPEPGDTNFLDYVFPARIEPIGGATVTLNNSTLGQRLPGVYAGAGLTLTPGARYDLAITTPDRTITGRAWMPGDFALVAPPDLDSVNHLTDTVVAVWTRSESVDTYIVGISPADSTSPAQGWSDGRTDTSCVVPASAFTDTLGNFVPGEYILGVTAVNGGWNRSALDLFLSGGNLDGAKGTFGCAVYPRPVRVIVR